MGGVSAYLRTFSPEYTCQVPYSLTVTPTHFATYFGGKGGGLNSEYLYFLLAVTPPPLCVARVAC